MQENRSFDHAYGTLRGVRGFNDPRAVTLPNGNPVWLAKQCPGGDLRAFSSQYQRRRTPPGWGLCRMAGWTKGKRATTADMTAGSIAKKLATNNSRTSALTLGYYNREEFRFITPSPMLSPFVTRISVPH